MDNEQIEQAKKSLYALKSRLEEIDKARDKRINVFEASGMTVQEVKHSAFLAWLLDPKKPHGLSSKVLAKFIERLFTYDEAARKIEAKPNREIIGDAFCFADDILTDPAITVETEKVLCKKESRIDIFISSPKARTVIVIENKVFSGQHDDQLNRYEKEVASHPEYGDKNKNGKYKKVFVFLTHNGDLPYDDEWCVFGYDEILRIVKEVKSDLPRGNANAKLNMLLEDYMELVDTNILRGNKELRALCKEIRREHKDALQILEAYSDNAAEVMAYSKNYLQQNYPDLIIYRSSKLSFSAYTKNMKSFFESRGEQLSDDNIVKCDIGVTCVDGPCIAGFSLTKHKENVWSETQKYLMEKIAPEKRQGSRFFCYRNELLLSADDREQPFESIKRQLTEKLDALVGIIRGFDNKVFSV